MEELKILVELLNTLPTLALWIIAAFFAYKVVCIGSMYGIVKLAINKLHDWLVRPPKAERKDISPTLRGITIDNAMEPLIDQLVRLKGKGVGIDSAYIHGASASWLREAIDAKEALAEVK
jgi:hypothetical protein